LAAAGGGPHGGERGVECSPGTRNVFAVCAVGPASRGTDLEGGNCGTARGTRSFASPALGCAVGGEARLLLPFCGAQRAHSSRRRGIRSCRSETRNFRNLEACREGDLRDSLFSGRLLQFVWKQPRFYCHDGAKASHDWYRVLLLPQVHPMQCYYRKFTQYVLYRIWIASVR
jgi:hypothetical protein